ncbi:Mor transcription activator family protein [Algicola sagamiensis]
MWHDFHEDNHLELSKKYNCSVQWRCKVVSTKHRLRPLQAA